MKIWEISLILVTISVFLTVGSFVDVDAMSQEDLHQIQVDENLCKQIIRSNSTLTFAEKLVFQKDCDKESWVSISNIMTPTPHTTIQIFQHQVRDCNEKYEMWGYLGTFEFLNMERSNLARHCTILYELDEWSMDGPDRMDILVDGLINALQEELDKDAEMRHQNTLERIKMFAIAVPGLWYTI